MAALAILICKVSIVLQVIAWLITGIAIIVQWHKLHKHWQLQHHAGDENTANHWVLQSDSGEYIDGRLLPQGYRSASLLVLAIGAESGRRILLPVWIDSVSSTQFSYLNLQLMFNTRGRI